MLGLLVHTSWLSPPCLSVSVFPLWWLTVSLEVETVHSYETPVPVYQTTLSHPESHSSWSMQWEWCQQPYL